MREKEVREMEVSFLPVMAAVLVVFYEGVLSFSDQTFWPGQDKNKLIKLPFVYHGGVWGDLLILPYLFGIWVPQMSVPWWLWIGFFPVAFVITWYCHKTWWRMCEKQPGFMYPDRSESRGDPERWHWDLPGAAWVHFIYMVGAVMMIGGHIYSPMPAEIVWRTCWLMLVFVPVAVIAPGIVQSWPPTKKDIAISVASAIVLWAVVGLVTWVKLIHWLGR
jgi:hypothetical protein